MAKSGKTNKTAAKRIKKSNPKGNKKPKLMYAKKKHHNLTKEDNRTKKRRNKEENKVGSKGYRKNFKKLINN